MSGGRPVALLAASDKRGLVELGRGLVDLGWELVATSGTAALLRESGLAAADIAVTTGLPTLLGGRLKSLHHRVFGGLLRRRGHDADEDEVRRFDFLRIDLLACNFYPFERATPAKDRRIELIDVGGPAMLRAAAKNHASVVPLADPDDYDAVLAALERAAGDPRGVSPSLRQALAARAFARTAAYDSAIAAWLEAG
ncbi:MAG TPA: hypothetical protein VN253_06455 [Kofleriaceae bacterium]|nr:hypothetical protein [Kofleriaceae bacterium]